MKYKKIILFVSFACLFSLNFKAALKTCTLTGDWDVGSTWSGGTIPACGDSIVIPAGKTVQIANQTDLSSGGCVGVKTIVVVTGTLTFQNGKKLHLACGSRVYIFPPTGKVDTQGGGGNNNLIDICGTDVWVASDGDKFGPTCFNPTDAVCVKWLPIELVKFSAEICDNIRVNVCLNWMTASEKNNQYFTVERSINSITYTEVAKIAAAGDSYVPRYYSAVDELPLVGLSYYRLKQTDFDNTFTYSSIVAIDMDFEIFVQNPSPAHDIPVSIKGNKGDVFEIKLVDVLGRVVFQDNITLETTGNNKIDINLTDRLTSCVVYLVVSNSFKTSKAKVVID